MPAVVALESRLQTVGFELVVELDQIVDLGILVDHKEPFNLVGVGFASLAKQAQSELIPHGRENQAAKIFKTGIKESLLASTPEK